MTDVIFIALVVAFFALALLVVVVCDRIATQESADELLDELLPQSSESNLA